ncbi:MAG: acyl carrier protein [Gammaproteobacteria bacterium]
MTNTAAALAEFIRIELLEDPDHELSASDQLLLDDIVDSLGVMRLVHFIEERGATSVPAEDVTIDNFATIETIAGYLGKRGVSLERAP